MPLRRIFRRQRNATVMLGEATRVDLDLRNDFVHIHRVPRTLLRMLGKVRPNGALTNTFAYLGPVVSWVAFGSVAAAFCLLWLPETTGRELESISGDGED